MVSISFISNFDRLMRSKSSLKTIGGLRTQRSRKRTKFEKSKSERLDEKGGGSEREMATAIVAAVRAGVQTLRVFWKIRLIRQSRLEIFLYTCWKFANATITHKFPS